jgi:hypothetical protein
MVQLYGVSDAEKEFLRYLNAHMTEIKSDTLSKYQDFSNYPNEKKTNISKLLNLEIDELKAIKRSYYNENGLILNKLKRINGQISYKYRAVQKYYGHIRQNIKNEIYQLKNEKSELEHKFEKTKNKGYLLKTKIQDMKSFMNSTLKSIDTDINELNKLNKDKKFITLRKGAFGERNVISHIKLVYDNDNEFHLINGFDIKLLGKAINIDNHTLCENKIDHILICPHGLFILETKAWKNYTEEGKNQIIKQLKKIKKVFEKTFSKKIDLNFVNIFLICTEKFIPLEENNSFKSIHLKDLKNKINQKEIILSKDEITLILNTFLPHLNSNHVSNRDKFNIKLKTAFVKVKRYIKNKTNLI